MKLQPAHGTPHVIYHGNVYTVVTVDGTKKDGKTGPVMRVVKVPLDGSRAQMEPLERGREIAASNDNHAYYTIAVDSAGYIHVVGGVHGQPFLPHWVSKRPEDISEFVFAAGENSNQGPQGHGVTYPVFFRSPDGTLYAKVRCAVPGGGIGGIALSVLDVKTQAWKMIGGVVPAADRKDLKDNGKATNKSPVANNYPLTAWEDNGEGGFHKYAQPHFTMCFGSGQRIHLVFGLLNKNTPTASVHNHTLTDLLYAYSDDGGQTIHRADGSKIEWPLRAEPGPHQGDVVWREDEGPPPWMGLGIHAGVNSANQPVISFESYKTGWHFMVQENVKWKEDREASAAANAGAKGRKGWGQIQQEWWRPIAKRLGLRNGHEDDPESEGDAGDAYGQYLPEVGAYLSFAYPGMSHQHYNRIVVTLRKPVEASGESNGKP